MDGDARMVADYYNANTGLFLRLGGSGQAAAIHRAIWAPGVEDAVAAFTYLNQLVAQAIDPAALLTSIRGEPLPALDLGCGVGGTATWIAQRSQLRVIGVSNSLAQVDHARRRAQQLGLQERCRFLHADFLDLPRLGPACAVYAIESFAHARDPQEFFIQASSQLAPGGRMVLCDDFLAEQPASPGDAGQAEAWLGRFRSGWCINSLLKPSEVIPLAANAGLKLVVSTDLTTYIKSFHPLVLRAAALATRLPLSWPYWQNLSGGSALQVCIQRGWTQYRVLVWEKR